MRSAEPLKKRLTRKHNSHQVMSNVRSLQIKLFP
ncbi:hypothetical protein PCPL58_3544 [Pseudomonas cerasi]|uniref:Uncharacterized protein n=1 Tax=Pseudomonas cerasi TaxID=1583341 RepID=A0A193SSJ1_9PSED|nr:hypothetical protein PCPL58_3544 [Pseudomonas cerasi]SOS21721.1 hypothetical protein PL963_03631 [Pseudomonas cerasi]